MFQKSLRFVVNFSYNDDLKMLCQPARFWLHCEVVKTIKSFIIHYVLYIIRKINV